MIFAKVDFVELNNVKLPIAFNMKALRLGAIESGKSINEVFQLMQSGDLSAGADLIPYFYHALCVGHEIQKKDLPFSREDMEMMDFEALGIFTEAFTRSVNKMDQTEKKQLKTVKKGVKN